MLGRSHRFLGITSTLGGVNVPCSRTQHGLTRVGLEPPSSGYGVRGINHQATALPSLRWENSTHENRHSKHTNVKTVKVYETFVKSIFPAHSIRNFCDSKRCKWPVKVLLYRGGAYNGLWGVGVF